MITKMITIKLHQKVTIATLVTVDCVYDNGRLDLANEICECKNILSGTHSNGQQW